MLKFTLLGCFLFIIARTSAQQVVTSPEWKSIAVYPRGAVDDGSVFVVGESMYMGCGIDQSFRLRNDWWRYNTNSEEWTEIDSLPAAPRQYASSFSYAERGFLMGGISEQGFTNACFEYNASTDDWTSLSEPPWTPRAAMASFTIGENAYLVGGRNDSIRFGDVWCFNFPSQTWSYASQLPFGPHDELIAFSIGLDAYITQGRSDSSTNMEVWKLDTRSMSWTRLQDFPGEARSYGAACNTAFGAVVLGGQNSARELLRECYYFTAENETWTELPGLPKELPIRGLGMVIIGGSLYTFGGLTERFTRVPDVLSLDILEFSDDGQVTDFRLFPNPTDETLFIQSKRPLSLELEVEISDIMGRGVSSFKIPAHQTMLSKDLKGLKHGVYDIRIMDATRRVMYHHQRIVVVE